MLESVVVVLAILWLLGFIKIPGVTIKNLTVFYLNGRQITLWDLLIFLVVLWAIGVLPTPLKEIAMVLLVLWVLSLLGILVIAGASTLLIISILVGLVFALFSGK
jgi:hypothetical protein